jgi:uncharacterized ferritin-like protein (DUF455 family)
MTIERLRMAGDETGVRLLERILSDEIRHVGIGTKHFVRRAEDSNELPAELWKTLVNRHFHGRLTGPYNNSARDTCGLSRVTAATLA